jgi:hypothetical protein
VRIATASSEDIRPGALSKILAPGLRLGFDDLAQDAGAHRGVRGVAEDAELGEVVPRVG